MALEALGMVETRGLVAAIRLLMQWLKPPTWNLLAPKKSVLV